MSDLMTKNQLCEHFKITRKIMDVLVLKLTPASYMGKYELYRLEEFEQEVNRYDFNDCPSEPPMGCAVLTQLAGMVNVRKEDIHKLKHDPTFPRPDGFYQESRGRKHPYFSIDKVTAWIEGDYIEDGTSRPEKNGVSGWAVPKFDPRETELCCRFNQVNRAISVALRM